MLNKVRSSSLLSGTAIYLTSSIINASIPFTLIPILTRYLAPTEYGQVAMFQTFLSALGAFVGLNITGAAARKYYDTQGNPENIKEFIASCFQILIFSTAIVFTIIWIFSEELSKWLDIEKKWLFTAIFVSAMSTIINLRLGQWQVRKKAYNYGAMQIAQSATNMGLSLVFIIVLLKGATGRIEAQIWATSAFALISVILLQYEKILNLFSWNISNIREALKFGIPLIPHVAGAFLLTSVDRFIINSELGLEKAGVYMVAVQISLAISLFFDSINKAYVPWLFERLNHNNEKEKLDIVRNTYLWFACILTGTTLAFWYGPWIITIIAGEKYLEAGDVIGWLIIAQGFSGMYLMVTNYIFYSKRTGLLSLATISAGTLNVLLLTFSINYYGIRGAAMSFSLSMLIRFLLTWWIAQKQHPMPWFDRNLIKEKILN